MAIETLDDIAEELANKMCIYGIARQEFVYRLKTRMKEAAEIERRLALPSDRN